MHRAPAPDHLLFQRHDRHAPSQDQGLEQVDHVINELLPPKTGKFQRRRTRWA
jgi:hypothetical protein